MQPILIHDGILAINGSYRKAQALPTSTPAHRMQALAPFLFTIGEPLEMFIEWMMQNNIVPDIGTTRGNSHVVSSAIVDAVSRIRMF